MNDLVIDCELDLDGVDYVEIVDLIDLLNNRLAKIPAELKNEEFLLERRMLTRSLKNFRKFC